MATPSGADVIVTAPADALHAPRPNPSRFRWSKRATRLYNGLDGLLVRTALVRARDYKTAQRRAGKIRGPADVARLCAHLADADTEYAVVVAVDDRKRPAAIYEMTEGSVRSFRLMPSQVIKVLLLAGVDACYIVHNHPQGMLRASTADVKMAAALDAALQCAGLRLLDSVIISRKGWYSMHEHDELPATGRRAVAPRGTTRNR